jgi:hypothetical protein
MNYLEKTMKSYGKFRNTKETSLSERKKDIILEIPLW